MSRNKREERQRLISIYRHTIDYCINKSYQVEAPIKYRFDSNEFNDEQIFSKEPLAKPAQICVMNIDTFEMAREMASQTESKILVLNLASNLKAGGGVVNGSVAQEEDLYRKSNYFQANNPDLYPLASEDVIYSPIVHIIKDDSYRLLRHPTVVSCLAVAAIRHPKLIFHSNKTSSFTNESDAILSQRKIEMIFKVAIKHGHTNLVLGALGCGVFENPVHQIAEIFRKAIIKYRMYFEKIGFAVLSGRNNSNYEIFHERLQG